MSLKLKIMCVRGIVLLCGFFSALLWLVKGGGSILGAYVCFGFTALSVLLAVGSFLPNRIGYYILVFSVPLLSLIIISGFNFIIFYRGNNVINVVFAVMIEMILPVALSSLLMKGIRQGMIWGEEPTVGEPKGSGR